MTTSAPRPSVAPATASRASLGSNDLRSEARRELSPLFDAVDGEDGRADVERDHAPPSARPRRARRRRRGRRALRLAADDRVVARSAGCRRGRRPPRRDTASGSGESTVSACGTRTKLGLGAVEARVDARVAEERPAGALRHAAGAAGGARAVRDHAHVHDALAGRGSTRHAAPTSTTIARELVAEDRPVLEAGTSARGTGRGRRRRSPQRRRGRSRPSPAARTRDPATSSTRTSSRRPQDDSPHAGCSISTR